ncbi:hypothetical protein F152LOC_00483 [Pectobacterium brasiliense]|nr:hypothetical protein F152LOC_00483 [Pectobacterium brasiliense]
MFSKYFNDAEMTLVYYVTFDLTKTHENTGVYREISTAIEKAGYSRDTKLEENALPYNFYAGKKVVNFNSKLKTPEQIVLGEKDAFTTLITNIINAIAPGKLERLFTSVSDAAHTKFHIG